MKAVTKFAIDVTGNETADLGQVWPTFLERLQKANNGDQSVGMMRKLENHLISKTFFNDGITHTDADIFLFDALYPVMAGLDRNQYCGVPSITRWFDHMQYILRESLGSHDMKTIEFNLDYVAPKKKAKKQQTKQPKQKQQQKKKSSPAASDVDPFCRLEFRVGVILSAEPHPDADGLYVEQVDLGEDAPRTIVSGLRKFVPLDEFVGSHVLVACNLRPRKVRGITSSGMVCCASTADHSAVELLVCEGASAGSRVTAGGMPEPVDVPLVPKKKKYFEEALANLSVKAGTAVYKGQPLALADGSVFKCKSLKDCEFG